MNIGEFGLGWFWRCCSSSGGILISVRSRLLPKLLSAGLVPSIDLRIGLCWENLFGEVWRELLARLGMLQIPVLDSELQEWHMFLRTE